MVRSPLFSSTSSSELVSASRSSAAADMIWRSSSSRSSVELRRPVISMIRLSAPTSSCVSAIVFSSISAGGRGCRLLGHEVLDEVSRDVAGAELWMVEDLQVEGDRRLDAPALDRELLERPDHPVDRAVAV